MKQPREVFGFRWFEEEVVNTDGERVLGWVCRTNTFSLQVCPNSVDGYESVATLFGKELAQLHSETDSDAVFRAVNIITHSLSQLKSILNQITE